MLREATRDFRHSLLARGGSGRRSARFVRELAVVAETAEEHRDHAAYVEALAALADFGTVDAWAARFAEA